MNHEHDHKGILTFNDRYKLNKIAIGTQFSMPNLDKKYVQIMQKIIHNLFLDWNFTNNLKKEKNHRAGKIKK